MLQFNCMPFFVLKFVFNYYRIFRLFWYFFFYLSLQWFFEVELIKNEFRKVKTK